MLPLLGEAGGAFRYDFIVARVLQSENAPRSTARSSFGFRTSRAKSVSLRIRVP
jgi:hypothetical protein